MIAEVVGSRDPFLSTPDWVLPGIAWGIDRLRGLSIETPLDANQVRLGGRFVYFDGSKAHEQLHRPTIPMKQSIADTYQWYQARGMIPQNGLARLLKRIGGSRR
jgi:nucleoside-diphosphate-sugar epimerase